MKENSVLSGISFRKKISLYCTYYYILWQKMCVPSCEIFLKSKTTLHATVLRPLRPRVQWTLLPCRAVRTEHEPLSISMDERNQPLNILFRSPWLVAAALSSAVVQLLSQPMQLRCWSSISVETPSTIRETKTPDIVVVFPTVLFLLFYILPLFLFFCRPQNR